MFPILTFRINVFKWQDDIAPIRQNVPFAEC